MYSNNKIYDHNDKLKLVTRINKIKKKKYLFQILNLIKVDNDVYNINSNGLFIFFHNLTNSTYAKIEKYVNHIYNKHTQTKISVATNEYTQSGRIISDYDFMDDLNSNIYASLSNKEKMILRKKNYDDHLNNNRE